VYYLAAAYIYLVAAGAVSIEGWLDAGSARLRRLLTLTALTTVLSLPLVRPILPASDIGWTYGANQELGETVGWPEFVQTVGSVWHSLPADQRKHAVIFTADYGEASAINELGRSTGLPTAVSGQNNEWFWGPGNPDTSSSGISAGKLRNIWCDWCPASRRQSAAPGGLHRRTQLPVPRRATNLVYRSTALMPG
jgi:hypothetical protein